MTEKQFANEVAAALQDEGYEFDPATIITLLTLLLPIIQNLPCFKKNVKQMEKNIDAEYRECCKKKRNRCPPKARKAMREELNITTKEEQDDYWAACCKVAFAHNAAVAKAIVSA